MNLSNKVIKIKDFDFFPIIIVFVVLLSYVRIYFLRDVYWDDNAWLLSIYASNNLEEFLNTGFYELRRVPLGIFLYNLFILHRITDYAYLVWHSISMSIQIATPIFLYLFIKNLFKDKQLLSFFAALSLVVFPLDTTLPYLSGINYRIATLLTLISFYLAQRSFAKEVTRWAMLFIALVISAISYYVFLELAIVFELPRLFIIGYIFYKKGTEDKALIKKTLTYWPPFFILCIPLVIYKLTYKPYGIYSGIYKTDLFFLLNWREHRKAIGMLLFYQWRILSQYISDVAFCSVLLSAFAAVIGFLVLRKLLSITRNEFEKKLKHNWHPTLIILLGGAIFLIPPIFLLEFAGREIGPGMNSSHFAPVQIGYAIILGGFLYYLYTMLLYNSYLKRHWLNLIFGLAVGAGVFFNNLNLDLFFKAQERQNHFWMTFINRFPSLPEKAVFMMDVRDFYYYDATDLDNSYDLEYMINLLYANSDDPANFRKYKVFAYEEFAPDMIEKINCNKSNEQKFERMTHFGKDALNPCEFIIVYYRDGKLMVNREIKEMFPDMPYREWLNNDFPALPDKPAAYPLRYKLDGFLDDNAL